VHHGVWCTGIQHALRGVKAASTPVGEAAFVAAHAEEFATKVCHLMDALDELPLPTQDRWLLLQGSLQLRMTHLPWVSEWAAVGTAVMDDEDYALRSTGTILGRERCAHVVHAKLTQPRRCGGFGVRHTNHLEGQAAYLSAAATAHCAMEARPAPFQPFEGPMGARLSQQWEALGGGPAHRRCDQHAHHCTGAAHLRSTHGTGSLRHVSGIC
jgi:hypothetical protein